MSDTKDKPETSVEVVRAEIIAHLPEAGEWLYAWIPENHPDFELIRDDFYGWATHRGIEPDKIWSGIVPAAKLPIKLKKALEEAYVVRWIHEAEWRRRCRGKSLRRGKRRKARLQG